MTKYRIHAKYHVSTEEHRKDSREIASWLYEQNAVESIKYDEDTGEPYRCFDIDLTKRPLAVDGGTKNVPAEKPDKDEQQQAPADAIAVGPIVPGPEQHPQQHQYPEQDAHSHGAELLRGWRRILPPNLK